AIVSADQPKIDRDEGQACTRGGGHDGVEVRGFVPLLYRAEPRVEPGQAQRAADRKRERGDPAEARRRLERPQEQDQRRRGPKGDIVRERIQLGPDPALGAEQARDAPIEAVEHAGKDDRSERPLPFAADREADAGQAHAQRKGGDRVGDHRTERYAARIPVVAHWLVPVTGMSSPTIPSTVSPAIARWPRSTRGA